MATYTLSGTGTQTLTAGTTQVYVAVTVVPSSSGIGRANPTSRYDIGLLRFGNASGWWAPVAINGGPQWIGLPFGCDRLGYAVFTGGTITVTEASGTSPFVGSFPSLAQLTDANVSSPTNGQVLTWDSATSRWVNSTPSGGGVSFDGARYYRAANQSIPNNTVTKVTLDTQTFDTASFWSAGSPTRLTIPTGKTGYYLIVGDITFNSAAGNNFERVDILLNNTSTIAISTTLGLGGAGNRLSVATIYHLNATDFVELECYQASGGALNLISEAPATSSLQIGRIG